MSLVSVSVAQCFHEKVGGRFGFGVYIRAPNATVWLPSRIVWHCMAVVLDSQRVICVHGAHWSACKVVKRQLVLPTQCEMHS